MSRRLIGFACIAALIAASVAQARFDVQRALKGVPRGRLNETIPGQIMVKLTQDRAALLAGSPIARNLLGPTIVPDGTFKSRLGESGWTLWLVPLDTDVRAMARELKKNPEVAYAEPVNRVYPMWTDPNDPDYWADEYDQGLIYDFYDEDVHFRRMWHLDDILAQDGWSIYPNQWYTAANKPRNAPLIAIIDTGCDMNHPDFINAGGTSSDAAQGGQIEKSLSAQFRYGQIDQGGSPEDKHGHGTHVAGIAVASGNNGPFDQNTYNGVIGIGYNSKAMILRVFDDQGVGTDADAAGAIFYAADQGADILNLSLGTENYSQLFQDAVTYAWQKGSLVVASGNEDGSGGGDLGPIYPAACSGAMGVSANGPYLAPATGTYSGYGYYVDMAAPGGDVYFAWDGSAYAIQFIWSTAMRTRGTLYDLSEQGILYPPYYTKYAYLAGTSMASPMVAGAAGLYYGKYNLDQKDGWSNVRAYRAIERSAFGVMGAPNGGWEPYQGYGSLYLPYLLQEAAGRTTTVGSIEGIVYYNATPVANVQVKAKKGNVTFSTTTQQDGTYRFDQMPAGTYFVECAPYGAYKSKNVLVKNGSDATGIDFWNGTFTWDTTNPTAARFDIPAQSIGKIRFTFWGYDTETGIDKITVQIGITSGGSETMMPTEIISDGNTYTVPPTVLLKFAKRYYVTLKYMNGAGMVTATTKDTVYYNPGG